MICECLLNNFLRPFSLAHQKREAFDRKNAIQTFQFPVSLCNCVLSCRQLRPFFLSYIFLLFNSICAREIDRSFSLLTSKKMRKRFFNETKVTLLYIQDSLLSALLQQRYRVARNLQTLSYYKVVLVQIANSLKPQQMHICANFAQLCSKEAHSQGLTLYRHGCSMHF